jgi:hypothetical protein
MVRILKILLLGALGDSALNITKLIRLTIVALLMGALAAFGTYRVITRPNTDKRVLSVPGSPGPLF